MLHRNRGGRAALVAAGWAIAAGAALAQAPAAPSPAPSALAGRPRLRDVCAADFQRFCTNVTPGHGRLTRCLQRRKNQLQRTCRIFLRAPAAAPAAAPPR
jgi:hypothetical protein